jgi:serine/threonine protein kinase
MAQRFRSAPTPEEYLAQFNAQQPQVNVIPDDEDFIPLPQVGDTIVGDDEDNINYRVLNILAQSHLGRIMSAGVFNGDVPLQQQVVIKEFRNDYRLLFPREGQRPRPALTLAKFKPRYMREWAAGKEIHRRLEISQPNEQSKLHYFILPETLITQMGISRDGGPLETAYIVYPFTEDSLNLTTFLRSRLFPFLYNTHRVGEYQIAVCNIARHIAKALSYLHQSGIIHHDIKPGNIIVSFNTSVPDVRDVSVHLIDFGLTCAFDDPLGLSVGGENMQWIHPQWPYRSTERYDDPYMATLRQPPLLWEIRRANEVAEIFSFARTLNEMFDLYYKLFVVRPARVVSQIALDFDNNRDLSPLPEGMFPLLLSMVADDLLARPSAADVAVLLERIRDNVDVTLFVPKSNRENAKNYAAYIAELPRASADTFYLSTPYTEEDDDG